MNAPVLNVQGLGKAFREYGTEWLRFASWFGLRTRLVEDNWVLRNISFAMNSGEAIGIVGQNGAGKSTLLKLITGTLLPNEGQISVYGRISAILELGMGFDPNLSGRQNVMHAAGLMGFSRQDVEATMDDIEAFAEIGDYFDEPVRTYSSGMQMRVAFSVASAFRPEILIVDEALSVGDAYFQHKCFKRIREFREQGTSLLIVSHDGGAIQSLCDRALLLEDGHLIKDGAPADVMDLYNALITERENRTVAVSGHASGREQIISGTGEAFVEDIVLLNDHDEPVEYVDVGQAVTLRLLVRVKEEIPRLVMGYMIKDRLGQPVFGTNTHHTEQALENVRTGERVEFRIRFPMQVGPGSYSVSTALVSTDTHLVNNYEWRDLALMFNVSNLSRSRFIGVAWIPPEIEISRP